MRFLRCLIVSAAIFVPVAARAEQIVLPVAIYAFGANESLWATEIRATNHSDGDLVLHVLDFVGVTSNLTFAPGDYVVPAGQTRSFGAYNLLSPDLAQCHGLSCDVGIGNDYFGAFVIDLDPGVSVEAAVLTGSSADIPKAGFPLTAVCQTWEGGVGTADGPTACVEGAGPLFQNTGDFRPAGTAIVLDWLHTQSSRRTNVTFYNPDPVVASVTLAVSSADRLSSASQTIAVPAHSLAQVNDIFSAAPFDAVRTRNGTATAAAGASITSTTRLYAIGWVISNQNNTVTISTPQ